MCQQLDVELCMRTFNSFTWIDNERYDMILNEGTADEHETVRIPV